MTEAQAVEAISSAFVTGWTAAQPTIPLALDNEAMPAADTFCSLAIRHGASQQITMGPVGARRWQRQLTVYARLFGPVDQGRAGLSTLVGTVRTLLEGVSLGGGASVEPVTMQAAMTREMGPDGRWWSVAVTVAGYYFETR